MATTVSQPRPDRVAAVLAQATRWTSARRKADGQPFFFIPGSTDGAVYMTSTIGCTCLAAQKSRSGDCKHQAAVRQRAATQDADRTARQIPGAEMPVTPTSHRPCARKCGATLPPESRLNYCDPCFERLSVVLASL